jgi:hypothetical protein
MRAAATTLLLVLATIACGPADRTSPSVDGGAEDDGEDGDYVQLGGTVWAPGNAPGMVPAGHEIPVFDAVVYLTSEPPAPIFQHVYCEACTQGTPNAAYSDHKGNFTLPRARIGDQKWLVVQKGQFRRQVQITVGTDLSILPASMTTLPSETDEAAGTWIPKIAIASGGADQMESIFGKLGIGEVTSGGGFVNASAAGHFDVYSNGGQLDGLAIGTLTELVSDLDKMRQYHIIFIPCSFNENTDALDVQQNLKNIRDYVKEGGRLYVADWSGEWMDMVFPAELELESSEDTPAAAYDRETDTWNTSMRGAADGGFYNSSDAEVTDPDMFMWLDGQSGPDGTYDASSFETHDNWNIIKKTNSVDLGVDENGDPVIDVPKTYVIGDTPSGGSKQAQTATFEPAGCGRVLYTTYHSVPGQHVGLVPQERILAYLLMEIGVCKAGPNVD